MHGLVTGEDPERRVDLELKRKTLGFRKRASGAGQ